MIVISGLKRSLSHRVVVEAAFQLKSSLEHVRNPFLQETPLQCKVRKEEK